MPQSTITATSILQQIKDGTQALVKGSGKDIYKSVYEAAVPVPPAVDAAEAATSAYFVKARNFRTMYSHIADLKKQVSGSAASWHRFTTQEAEQILNTENAEKLLQSYHQYFSILRDVLPAAQTAEATQKQMYATIFHFQAEVNNVTGVSIDIIYVWQNNNENIPIKISHDDINQYLRFNWRSGKLSFVTDDEMVKVIDSLTNEQKKEAIAIKVQPKLNALIQEIKRRKIAASKKRSPYLTWKKDGMSNKIKFGSLGYYLEAYVNAAINGGEEELANHFSDMDESIDWFVKKWMTQVDNAAGFATEDVQIGDSLSYYGIKSQSASLMGYKNILQFAEQVISAYENGTFDDAIAKTIDRLWAGSVQYYKLEDIIQVNLDKEEDKLIKEYLK